MIPELIGAAIARRPLICFEPQGLVPANRETEKQGLWFPLLESAAWLADSPQAIAHYINRRKELLPELNKKQSRLYPQNNGKTWEKRFLALIAS